MFDRRFERLNALKEINLARKYLEIGVCKGVTFTQVEVSHKVAVDPKFRFNTEEYSNSTTEFHEVPSDFYFSNIVLRDEKFDLIYLDGLHTFEQTFRDFCASTAYSHEQTIWLIDDTYPVNSFAADRDQARAAKLRRIVGESSAKWMGDVYKTVFAIHDFFPQYSYATFPGHGQTVVWREVRPSFNPIFNSFELISRLDYSDFLEHKNLLVQMDDPAVILEKVKIAFSSQGAVAVAG